MKMNFDTLGSAKAMTIEYQRLKADNARLRAALESAPNPQEYGVALNEFRHQSVDWFNGPRAEALKQ